jgi:hypothetical protein
MLTRNTAYQMYNRRIAVASVLYVAAVFAASSVLHHRAPVSPLAIGVALVPGIAVSLMIYAMARLMLELDDEYLRLLEVRKALIATALTLAACSAWGLLEIFTAVPALPVFWVFPLWCVGLFAGALFNRLTLGKGGGL